MNKKKWQEIKIVHNIPTKWNYIVQYPENLRLGKYVDINAFTYINAHYGVEIGDNVLIGSHVAIHSHSTIDEPEKRGKIIIGDKVKVGSHATIMPGVVIGGNVVIGAYSFVNKDIPANAFAFGVPVEIIKRNKK